MPALQCVILVTFPHTAIDFSWVSTATYRYYIGNRLQETQPHLMICRQPYCNIETGGENGFSRAKGSREAAYLDILKERKDVFDVDSR